MLDDALLQAAGTLRKTYEGVDWAATPIGAMESWSPALRNALDMVLQTGFPVSLFWGPELVLLYNQAFVRLIADKHPAALGTRARDFVPEAWDTVGPWMRSVLAGEGPIWIEDALVPLQRHGVLEEAYFTFSYSPVRGLDGQVEGVMNTTTETTRQVIDRRRLVTLGRLRETLGEVDRAERVSTLALPILRSNGDDLPEVDIRPAAEPRPGDPGARPFEREELEETEACRVARFPLGSARDTGRRPMLVIRLSDRLAPDEAYLGFLRLIASVLGQAIDRITAREAERDIAAAERSLSEALQRSLLTQPLQPDRLQLAVRYRPAAERAQVGGDWYDSFPTHDGSLSVVVGDVTGHDLRAVAGMAQVRSLLRGVSYATQKSPAGALMALDQAMHGLAVGVYATAILARIEQDDTAGDRGLRTMRWSNAGHPPPVVLGPDGRARLLEAPPDPLLGLGGGARGDQTVSLDAGSIVVFYTDGLVERRAVALQERFQWLTGVLEGCQEMSAEELCDHLLTQLDGTVEDDVALLILKVDPEDTPRPSPL